MSSTSVRKKILHDVLALLSRSIIIRILRFPVTVITARVLGPAGYGLLQIINYIPGLTKYGSLGYDSAAYREIAHLRGAKELDQESLIKNVAFTSDLIWSLFLVILIVAFSFGYNDVRVRWGLRVAAITLFLQQLGRLYAVQLKLRKAFKLLAKVQVIGEFIVSAFILSTIWWWEIFGVLLAGTASAAVIVVLCWRHIPILFSVQFQREEWWRLTKVAAPMAMVTVAYGTFGWLERGLVGHLFGLRLLGIYMLTVTALKVIMAVVSSTLMATSVHVYERLGRGSDEEALGNILAGPTLSFAFVLPVIGGAVIFLGPQFIRVFLSDYTDVIPLLPWLAAILWVRALPTVYATAMNSRRLNQQSRIFAFWIIVNLIFTTATYVLVRLDYGLVAPLIGKLISFTVLAILVFGSTRDAMWSSQRQFIRDILHYLAPLLWGLGAIWMVHILTMKAEAWISALTHMVFFITLYFPALWYWENRIGLFTELRNHWTKSKSNSA